ncbi:MAG: prenyltransferase [Chloroflexi bacterium]|nr:prenyltransferase [Chloroflexota bacterium]
MNKALEFISRVWNFIRLTRFVFLLGGFLLYALGAASAARMGAHINLAAYLIGQVVVTAIQLMAQYLNEYYDIEVDRLSAGSRTWFSGGSGILAAGGVPLSTVRTAARICGLVALLSGILAAILSPWTIPIILLSFLGAWFYSSPPLSLMSSGWGELTTSLIVAMLVPLVGYTIQAGLPPVELWLVVIPLVLVHAAMLISFEIPDHSADRLVGKQTLTVRLGIFRASRLMQVLIGLSFLFLIVLTLFTEYPVQWMWVAIPLAIWQMTYINQVVRLPTRTRYHLLTAGGVGLFSLLSLMALLGVVLEALANS